MSSGSAILNSEKISAVIFEEPFEQMGLVIWLFKAKKCRFIRGVFLVVDLGSEIIFCAIACHHCLAILMLQGNNKKNLGKHWGRKEEDLKGKNRKSLHFTPIQLLFVTSFIAEIYFLQILMLRQFWTLSIVIIYCSETFQRIFYHFSKLHKKKIYLGNHQSLGTIKRNFNLVPS